jgi:hypothetical protein
MKKIFLIPVFIFCFALASHAQVVVKIKPAAPNIAVVKPPCPSPKHVWIEGHWVWDKTKKQYIWNRGYWIKPKKHKVWKEGHWVEVPNGFKWIPGHWGKK